MSSLADSTSEGTMTNTSIVVEKGSSMVFEAVCGSTAVAVAVIADYTSIVVLEVRG